MVTKKQRAAKTIRQKWRVGYFQPKQRKVNTKCDEGHHKKRGRPSIMVPKNHLAKSNKIIKALVVVVVTDLS